MSCSEIVPEVLHGTPSTLLLYPPVALSPAPTFIVAPRFVEIVAIPIALWFLNISVAGNSKVITKLIVTNKYVALKLLRVSIQRKFIKIPLMTNLGCKKVKNPKIIDDKEKVQRYLLMIKEENKRMHAQVENVLRISKLEKNELDISKEPRDVTEIIEHFTKLNSPLPNDTVVQILIQTRMSNLHLTYCQNQFYLSSSRPVVWQ